MNDNVAFNHEKILIEMLDYLMKKAKEEDEANKASQLKIYSQIVRKILASINIFRFNSYFYSFLKNVLFYVIERPQSSIDDTADLAVTTQLCES